jgi:hypothetical protein
VAVVIPLRSANTYVLVEDVKHGISNPCGYKS